MPEPAERSPLISPPVAADTRADAVARGDCPATSGGDDGGGGGLVAELRAESLRLGFSRLGIAPAGPPPRQERFRHWLRDGHAGAMTEWLARQETLRSDPDLLLAGVRSVVMLATDHAVGPAGDGAASFPAAPRPAGQGRGRVARYAWGDDYHDLLRARVNRLGAWLEARVPGCRTRGVVDSAPLAERDFAWLAGLGWVGKNTMLIDPRAGSFFLLTALLTDLVLPSDAPVEFDHCGTCTACLDACPTGAFVAPRVLDARRCISAITIEDHGGVDPALRQGMGEWIFGCDVCQEVCPWNRHAPGSAEPTLQPRADTDGSRDGTLSLVELLALDEDAFRRRFRGSPLVRAKRRGLLRSAAIALGNRPDPGAFPALAAAAADAEPVVRAAAVWALAQWRRAGGMLGGRAAAALAARLAVEDDAAVRAELADAVAAE
jgi:epoxyqueuosine reductase